MIPEQSRFTGHVEIDVDMPAGARRVYMHGGDLKVNQVVVRAAGRTIPATFRQIDRTGVARLDLTEAAAGGPATLVFDYSAPFGIGLRACTTSRLAASGTGVPAAQALADRAVSSEDPVFRGAVMSTIFTK